MDIDEVKGIAQVYMSMQEKAKYPHMMYDPKTGKEVEAKTPEDHEKLAKMGYTHDKPKEDASNDKSDDGEGMDKVDKKALKKKFKDRKDKDIDNDGDTDDSDEYLHKKRLFQKLLTMTSASLLQQPKLLKKRAKRNLPLPVKSMTLKKPWTKTSRCMYITSVMSPKKKATFMPAARWKLKLKQRTMAISLLCL